MKNLKEKLKILYGSKADEAHQELTKIISQYKKKNAKKSTNSDPIFSEKDVMLICYADHVQESGVKTLQTMRLFLRKYAKGIINRVHFLPFFDHSEFDIGFSVKNYNKVHEDYGDWEDIKKIGEDFSFMFDLVLNHASIQGDIANKQLAGDKNYKDFFLILDEKIDTAKVFRPRTHPLFTEVSTKDGKKYAWTTFSEDQVDWNFKNPKVLIEMIKTLLLYFENGAQAIRLDAVAYIWKKLGTACFDLEECHIVVQIFRDVFRECEPRAWAIAETVLPHEKNIEYLGNGQNESHFVYNFALETLLLHTFLEADTSVANEFFDRISNDFSEETSILNLSVSHDGLHVIPAKGVLNNKQMMAVAKDCEKKGAKVLYRTLEGGKGKTEPYELNISYPSAIEGVEKYLASQAIQLALKGVPLIYLNNLIGAENWSEGVKKLGYSRAINRQKFDYKTLVKTLRSKNSRQAKIYTGYKKLLKIRTSEPLFSPSANQNILEIDKRVLAIHRSSRSKNLIALTNVSDNMIELSSVKIKNILDKEKAINIIDNSKINIKDKIRLHPYSIMWLK
ncbi:sugar phosphorylase [Candidatus Parcubacteria bacterium]|nr:sugar phosphorylase [Candidatus Parcubacteria bacterium]